MKKLLGLSLLLIGASSYAGVNCTGPDSSVIQNGNKIQISAGSFSGTLSISKITETIVISEKDDSDSANFLRATIVLDDEDSQMTIFDNNAHPNNFDLECR